LSVGSEHFGLIGDGISLMIRRHPHVLRSTKRAGRAWGGLDDTWRGPSHPVSSSTLRRAYSTEACHVVSEHGPKSSVSFWKQFSIARHYRHGGPVRGANRIRPRSRFWRCARVSKSHL